MYYPINYKFYFRKDKIFTWWNSNKKLDKRVDRTSTWVTVCPRARVDIVPRPTALSFPSRESSSAVRSRATTDGMTRSGLSIVLNRLEDEGKTSYPENSGWTSLWGYSSTHCSWVVSRPCFVTTFCRRWNIRPNLLGTSLLTLGPCRGSYSVGKERPVDETHVSWRDPWSRFEFQCGPGVPWRSNDLYVIGCVGSWLKVFPVEYRLE